jgi:spherulation-specific family 4 protein
VTVALPARRRTRVGLAAICGLGVLAMVAVAMAVRSADGEECRSALIPAYLRPDGIAQIAQRPVRRRIVVVNPDNGPGAAPQRGYRSAIAAQQRAGTRVLGYVHTGWGARDPAVVRADAERYRAWYGVDGVFFDESSHDGAHLPYYEDLARQARASGARVVALNPGTIPARGYFDLADVVVTFEGAYPAYADAVRRAPGWLRDVAPGKVAHLLYGASREEALRAVREDSAGFVYATSASLPDPWSTLPAYLDELEARLEACG